MGLDGAGKRTGMRRQAQAPSRGPCTQGTAEGSLHQPQAVTRPAVNVAIISRPRRPVRKKGKR